jgi:hypothetical protein
VRGSRIITDDQLDACEGQISDWFIAVDDANTQLNNTASTDDIEGVFDILDSFAYFTPIVENCYNMGLYMKESAVDAYNNGELMPLPISSNLLRQSFYLVSDVLGETSNVFYQDWYSFAYYIGDMVYRLVLADSNGLSL